MARSIESLFIFCIVIFTMTIDKNKVGNIIHGKMREVSLNRVSHGLVSLEALNSQLQTKKKIKSIKFKNRSRVSKNK